MAGTGSLVKFTTDSLLKLQIRDGGTLHFRSAAVDAVRGIDSVSGLLFDEAAFQPQLKLSLSAALPAMSQVRDKGRVILCSTPNGASGPYFDQLNTFPDCIADIDKIRSGELGPVQKWVKPNGNIAIAIHWRAVYGDNPRYLEELQDSLGLPRSEVAQEYDLSLNEASEAVFGFAVVRACAIGEYEPWDPDGIYYWGVDPAGSGADYFTAICLRKTQDGLNVAKLYRKRTGTLEVHMAHIDNQIRESIPISVCVEGNGLGQFVYEALQGSHGSIVDKFNTTANSKAAIIGRLQLALECKKLTFPANSPIEQELLSFRRVGDKLQAAEGSHDDTVMALALALRAAS